MEIGDITRTIGDNTYKNDIRDCRVYKNDDIYRNYAILIIEDNGTVVYKQNNVISILDIIDEDDEYRSVLEAFSTPVNEKKTTARKKGKESVKDDK